MLVKAFNALAALLLSIDPSLFIEEYRAQLGRLPEDDPLELPAVLIQLRTPQIPQTKRCAWAEVQFTLHVCGEVLKPSHSGADQAAAVDTIYAEADFLIDGLREVDKVRLSSVSPGSVQESVYAHRIEGSIQVEL